MILHPAINDIASRYKQLDESIRKGSLNLDGAFGQYAWVRKDSNSLGMANLGAADLMGIDEENHGIPFTISQYETDRDGDLVVPMGCQLEQYKLNPVVFFGHQENPYPIARSLSPDGRITVWPEENRIRAMAYFDVDDPDADFVYGKIKRNFLRGASIAFLPVEAYRRDEIEKASHRNEQGAPKGWKFIQYLLTEWSVVSIPSCASAIRDAFDTEKQYISPRLQKALLPYCAKSINESGGCWTGWCPCPPCDTKKENKMTVEKNQGYEESGKPLNAVFTVDCEKVPKASVEAYFNNLESRTDVKVTSRNYPHYTIDAAEGFKRQIIAWLDEEKRWAKSLNGVVEKHPTDSKGEAYLVGYEDHQSGKPLSGNPYTNETGNAVAWMSGWNDAKTGKSPNPSKSLTKISDATARSRFDVLAAKVRKPDGSWVDANSRDVPAWVEDAIMYQIVDDGLKLGTVQQGSESWEWKKKELKKNITKEVGVCRICGVDAQLNAGGMCAQCEVEANEKKSLTKHFTLPLSLRTKDGVSERLYRVAGDYEVDAEPIGKDLVKVEGSSDAVRLFAKKLGLREKSHTTVYVDPDKKREFRREVTQVGLRCDGLGEDNTHAIFAIYGDPKKEEEFKLKYDTKFKSHTQKGFEFSIDGHDGYMADDILEMASNAEGSDRTLISRTAAWLRNAKPGDKYNNPAFGVSVLCTKSHVHKSCGCDDCSKGHACGCHGKKKGISDWFGGSKSPTIGATIQTTRDSNRPGGFKAGQMGKITEVYDAEAGYIVADINGTLTDLEAGSYKVKSVRKNSQQPLIDEFLAWMKQQPGWLDANAETLAMQFINSTAKNSSDMQTLRGRIRMGKKSITGMDVIKKETGDIAPRDIEEVVGKADVKCPDCHGTGMKGDDECSYCGGQGMVDEEDKSLRRKVASQCSRCRGTGEKWVPATMCDVCEGQGHKDGVKCNRCRGTGEKWVPATMCDVCEGQGWVDKSLRRKSGKYQYLSVDGEGDEWYVYSDITGDQVYGPMDQRGAEVWAANNDKFHEDKSLEALITRKLKALVKKSDTFKNEQVWRTNAEQRGFKVREMTHPSGVGTHLTAKDREGNMGGEFDLDHNTGWLENPMYGKSLTPQIVAKAYGSVKKTQVYTVFYRRGESGSLPAEQRFGTESQADAFANKINNEGGEADVREERDPNERMQEYLDRNKSLATERLSKSDTAYLIKRADGYHACLVIGGTMVKAVRKANTKDSFKAAKAFGFTGSMKMVRKTKPPVSINQAGGAGYGAFLDGKEETDCPYNQGDVDQNGYWRAWRRGWLDAKRDQSQQVSDGRD